ncbi:DUF3782 domain-containing protein, partial [Cylindrospermopsis raciborskii]
MSNETITLADIFALFKESERQREAEQAEQKRLSQERQQEYEQRQREHEERQRKHEEDMEQFRISMEETRKMVAETNKHMGSITSRWGEFVENLVRPAAVRLFKEQGINVHYTSLEVKAHDYKGSIEIDIWAENDGEIVAIEVKSHLKVRDIKRFIKVLDRFKDIFPKYKNYR